MAFIKWDNSFSVKLPSIDEQHLKLVEYINEFYEKVLANKGDNKEYNKLVSELIKNMKDYTIFHFKYEEELLENYNYSEVGTQVDEHAEFVKRVTEWETKFNKGQILLTFEITDFLKKWLVEHIKVSDMKYSDYMVAKGAK